MVTTDRSTTARRWAGAAGSTPHERWRRHGERRCVVGTGGEAVRREVVVAFVDLAGFTALTDVHGDDEAIRVLERFEALSCAAVAGTGRLVKTVGDAVMLSFSSGAKALEAMAALSDACLGAPGLPLPRAGMHAGVVVERRGDLFGATVNECARIASLARPGEVLLSAPLAVVARQRALTLVELGAVPLRNVRVPVELFAVTLAPPGRQGPVDPVCRAQIGPGQETERTGRDDHEYRFCSARCAGAFEADPGRYIGAP